MSIKTQKSILISLFFLIAFIVYFLSTGNTNASQYFLNPESPPTQKCNKSPLNKECSHAVQTEKSLSDADNYTSFEYAIDWTAEHAIPLDTFDPEAGFEDLEPARPIFENRRLIMLGEGAHGIMEAGEYKLRLIAYLYLELGYDLISIEGGVAYGRMVDEYIQTGDENILNTIQFTGYSQTDGYRAFLEGLRRINANRPARYKHKPLRFSGFDLDFGNDGLKYLRSYLEETGADDVLAEMRSYINYCEDTIECDEAAVASLAVFQDAQDELVAASSVKKYNDVLRIFQNTVDRFRYYRLDSENVDEANIFREGIMKQNIDFILAKKHGGVILSGHNIHFARALTSPTGEYADEKYETLGEYLVNTHAEDEVVSLAMTFARGTQLALDGTQYLVLSVPVFPGEVEGSLENIFQNVGFSPFIVEIRSARCGSNPDASWLLEPHAMLSNGSYEAITPAPALQWDAILFIDEVRASKIVEPSSN